MKISQEEIKKIALLSRLEVKEEHMAHVEKELSDILTYVAELDALELDGVEPMAHAVPLHNVLMLQKQRMGTLKYLALYKNRRFRCGNNS